MSQVTIAAGTRIAAESGARIAAAGGNAVDAALAAMTVSMCTDIGIMSPGCGAFVTVWPHAGEPCVIDGYVEMPGRGLENRDFSDATHEVVFDYGGDTWQRVGYGTIATPGGFAGLALASKRFGHLPWRELMQPAIELVDQGFPLTGGAAEYLGFTHEAIYTWHPESYRILHHADGSPLAAGDTVRIPHLAETLAQIAQDSAALYSGDLGTRIAREVRANGGALGIEDLRAYQAIAREPVRASIGEWDVASNPPPAVGGACLAAMLLLLDRFDGADDLRLAVAAMVRAQRAVLAYRDRCLDGESHGLPPAIDKLLELAARADNGLLEAPSTSHVSAIDANGLACAITASAGYGSGALAEGTGFWLNNSLGELDLHTRGLQHLQPGTRLASNMAPTIARRRSDGAMLAIGSPGASRITTAITQVLFNFALRGMDLDAAVSFPRLHVELTGNTIAHEPELPLEPAFDLRPRPFAGHSMYFGGVQAVLGGPGQPMQGVADARRGGFVAAG